MAARANAIDTYLGRIEPTRRAALAKLRATIHAALPAVEECISYGMPAFRVRGAGGGPPSRTHVVAGFMATKGGCSYYPFSGSTLAHADLAASMADYEHTKSALHFDPKRGLPAALVRKLLATRVSEIGKAGAGKRAGRAARNAAKARAR